jgi:hypothetical protein
MRWVEVWWRDMKENRQLEKIGVVRRIILKRKFKKGMMGHGLD